MKRRDTSDIVTIKHERIYLEVFGKWYWISRVDYNKMLKFNAKKKIY